MSDKEEYTKNNVTSGLLYYFQMIILMALAKGRSRILAGPVTLHTETAIHVAHLMTKVTMVVVTYVRLKYKMFMESGDNSSLKRLVDD